ncbi:hypothetical protein [Flavisolibacter tropicus]|uniref:Uncharacterized protein n=1 Tax=Flavisolibacter tropicus TaxID=1492898 RepID=A0A172TXE2_9BACT|nr:hypothetical protein [Flavisolibacter tropicus]ANE51759.1 hypothetical protein SY85_15910 [Flavisolibacter tropicus]
MKNLVLAFTLLFAVKGQSQVVSGLYGGTLVNDSTHKVQNYEVALSEYRGKITGYSYTTFVVNDTFFYSVKTVKANLKDNELVIQDDKMIVNNFPEAPAKGVKQTNIIPVMAAGPADTVRGFNGKWSTNQTKVYYSLYGGLEMKRDSDSSQSALIGHLRELKILGPAYAATRTDAIAVADNATNKQKQPTKAVVVKTPTATTPSVSNTAVPTSIPYAQRAEKILQTLSVGSDSLTLSFYDNGVVDGDMISVYVNGETVIDNTKLTAVAVKKTIAVNATAGEIKLILVAETLGTLPPNTGLLIIQDGDNRYNVHFSADLQTNAAIILRRK